MKTHAKFFFHSHSMFHWYGVKLCVFILLFGCILHPVYTMMIRKEIQNPEFNFFVSEATYCITSPDIRYAESPTYFLVQCKEHVADITIRFPEHVLPVYDNHFNSIKHLSVNLNKKSQYSFIIHICQNVKIIETCNDKHIDIQRIPNNMPELHHLYFSNYPIHPPPFQSTILLYTVTLFDGEPVRVTASTSSNFFVSFHFNGKEQHSIESSSSMLLTPIANDNTLPFFKIHVYTHDKQLQTTYMITIKTVNSMNSQLGSFQITPGSLDSIFVPNHYAYQYYVPIGTRKIHFTAIPLNQQHTQCMLIKKSLGKNYSFKLSDRLTSIKKNILGDFTHSTIEQSGDVVLLSKTPMTLLIDRADHPLIPSMFVIQCIATDATFYTRYTFTMIEDPNENTQLDTLEIPHYSLFPSFQSNMYGPYYATFNSSNKTSQLHQKWIEFHLTLKNKNHQLKMNGLPIYNHGTLSSYFRVPYGEDYIFDITVYTNNHHIKKDYIVILQHHSPWYTKNKLIQFLSYLFYWMSVIISSTISNCFILNMQFFQFLTAHLCTTHSPIYQTFLSHMDPLYGYRGSFNSYHLNHLTSVVDSTVVGYHQIINPMRPHMMVYNQQSYHRVPLPFIRLSHTPKKNTVDLKPLLREPVKQLGLSSLSPIQQRDQFNLTKQSLKQHQKISHPYVFNYLLLKKMLSNIHQDAQFDLQENNWETQQHSFNLSTIETSYGTLDDTILSELENDFLIQQMMTLQYSILIVLSHVIFGFLVMYSILWIIVLKDPNNSFLTLRQSYVTWLKPWKCLLFVFECLLYPYILSCCSILFAKHCWPQQAYSFAFLGFSYTPFYIQMIAFSGLLCSLLTVLFFSIILFRIQKNLVYSTLTQRFHDKQSRSLKAKYHRFPSIPLLDHFTTTEIQHVISIASPDTSNKVIPIHLLEELELNTPFISSKSISQQYSIEDPFLTHPITEGSKTYPVPIKYHLQCPLYDVSNTLYLYVKLVYNDDQPYSTIMTPSISQHYPNAFLGQLHYHMKDSLGHINHLLMNVEIRHLLPLITLDSSSLWVPEDHLHFNYVDNFELFFYKAVKGNPFHWVINHIMMIGFIISITLWDNSTIPLWIFASSYLFYSVWLFKLTISSLLIKWSQYHTTYEKTVKNYYNPQHCVNQTTQYVATLPLTNPLHYPWSVKQSLRQFCQHAVRRMISWKDCYHRCVFILREWIIGPVPTELSKSLILFSLILQRQDILLTHQVTIFFLTISCIVMSLISINYDAIVPFILQLYAMIDTMSYICSHLSYKVYTVCQNTNYCLSKISLWNRFFQTNHLGYLSIPNAYFFEDILHHCSVKEIACINNELGMYLSGKIVPMTTMHRFACSQPLLHNNTHIKKSLHLFGVYQHDRYALTQSMPIQLSFKQFYTLGKKTINEAMSLERLVCTVQIINGNETTQYNNKNTLTQSASHNDSFLSLYKDEILMPEFGKLTLKTQQYGYIVRWCVEKQHISIQGYGIKKGTLYEIKSKIPVNHKDNCQTDIHLYNAESNESSKCNTQETTGVCTESGQITIQLPLEIRPDLTKKIKIKVDDNQEYEVNPMTVYVESRQTTRAYETIYELIIRSRYLLSRMDPYVIEWSVKKKEVLIDCQMTALDMGLLLIPWDCTSPPNLNYPLELISCNNGIKETIEIDPHLTDAHQFYFHINPETVQSQSLTLQELSSPLKREHVIIPKIYELFGREPIVCTLMECMDSEQQLYQIQPNFHHGILKIRASIETLYALKHDLNNIQHLSNIWKQFMTRHEYIQFWDTNEIPIMAYGYWLNPFNSITDMTTLKEKEHLQDVIQLFFKTIYDRITHCIELLTNNLNIYQHLNEAFTDKELYIMQRMHDQVILQSNESNVFYPILEQLKKKYSACCIGFQYPFILEGHTLCEIEQLSRQFDVWKQQLTHWLIHWEGGSDYMYQGQMSCVDNVLESILDSVKYHLKLRVYTTQSTEHQLLHFVTNSQILKGLNHYWRPHPVQAHICMVRMFLAKHPHQTTNPQHWKEIWIPCYIKLGTTKLIIHFPPHIHTIPTIQDPIDLTYDFSNLQGYYIPLDCLDTMLLTNEKKMGMNSDHSTGLNDMPSTLVLHKRSECPMDDQYIKDIHTGDYLNQRIYDSTNQTYLMMRLYYTINDVNDDILQQPDTYVKNGHYHLLPLTFRFSSIYYHQWESAIQQASMHLPYSQYSSSNRGIKSCHQRIHVNSKDILSPISAQSDLFNTTTTTTHHVLSHILHQETIDPSAVNTQQTICIHSEQHHTTTTTTCIPTLPTITGINEDNNNMALIPLDSPVPILTHPIHNKTHDNNSGFYLQEDVTRHPTTPIVIGRCLSYPLKDVNGIQWLLTLEYMSGSIYHGDLICQQIHDLYHCKKDDVMTNEKLVIISLNGLFSIHAMKDPSITLSTTDSTLNNETSYTHDTTQLCQLLSEQVNASLTSSQSMIIPNDQVVITSHDGYTAMSDPTLQSENENHMVSSTIHHVPASNYQHPPERSRSHHPGTDMCVPEDNNTVMSKMIVEDIMNLCIEGNIVYSNGSRYKGQLLQQTPHGHGHYLNATNTILYTGMWSYGLFHGKGILIIKDEQHQNQYEYFGHFVKHSRDGKGIQYIHNRAIKIQGEFKNNIVHGLACTLEIFDPSLMIDGSSPIYMTRYIGQITDGVPDGIGTLHWNDHIFYEGEFKDGLRHGQGLLKHTHHGVLIDGEWSHDVPNGNVHQLLTNVEWNYIGQMKDGKRSGKGTLYKTNNIIYEGDWLCDQPHGQGIYYANDGIYKGDFKKGKRCGKGLFHFKSHQLFNGQHRMYQGDWKNHVPHGTGRYLDETGMSQTYQFINGVMEKKSHNCFKVSLCGKQSTLKVPFYIESSIIDIHSSHYWGPYRQLNTDKLRQLLSLGSEQCDIYSRQQLVCTDPTLSSPINQEQIDPYITTAPILPVLLPNDTFLSLKDGPTFTIKISDVLFTYPIDTLLNIYCTVRVGRYMKTITPTTWTESKIELGQSLVFLKQQGLMSIQLYQKQSLTRDTHLGIGCYSLDNCFEKHETNSLIEIPLLLNEDETNTPIGTLHLTIEQ